MARYLFLAFSNPVAGREDEYNDWYDTHHVRDVVNVPGFICGQRFRLASTQFALSQPPPHRYLALYEIDTDDVAATFQCVLDRLGTDAMVGCEAFDLAGLNAPLFEAIGPRITAPVTGG